MKEEDILNKKEKTVILLAASIASGCQPCTKYHIERSLESGFTEEEIRKIVVLAISVRDKATRYMEFFAHNKEAETGTGITGTGGALVEVGGAEVWAVAILVPR